MKTAHFPVLFFSFISLAVFAQTNPVNWAFSSEKIGDNQYKVKLVANIATGWNIYSQHTDPTGPVPTSFSFNENPNIELIGKVEESGKKKEGFDQLFEVNVIKFSGQVTFTQTVKVKNGAQNISGFLEFMCCDEEKCLPPKEVSFDIPLK